MLALQSQLGNADGFVVFSHLTIFEIIIIEKILNYPVLYFELNLTEFLTAIILIQEVADMRQIVANIKGNELMYTVSLLDLQRCHKRGAKVPFNTVYVKLACFLVETRMQVGLSGRWCLAQLVRGSFIHLFCEIIDT